MHCYGEHVAALDADVVVRAVAVEDRAVGIFLPAGTVYTPEPISAGAKATIFELK